jgi:hypothetical protein
MMVVLVQLAVDVLASQRVVTSHIYEGILVAVMRVQPFSGHKRWLLATSSGVWLQLAALTGPAYADSEIDEWVDTFVACWGPTVTNLGFSGIMGFCAAKALRVRSFFMIIAACTAVSSRTGCSAVESAEQWSH